VTTINRYSQENTTIFQQLKICTQSEIRSHLASGSSWWWITWLWQFTNWHRTVASLCRTESLSDVKSLLLLQQMLLACQLQLQYNKEAQLQYLKSQQYTVNFPIVIH